MLVVVTGAVVPLTAQVPLMQLAGRPWPQGMHARQPGSFSPLIPTSSP